MIALLQVTLSDGAQAFLARNHVIAILNPTVCDRRSDPVVRARATCVFILTTGVRLTVDGLASEHAKAIFGTESPSVEDYVSHQAARDTGGGRQLSLAG